MNSFKISRPAIRLIRFLLPACMIIYGLILQSNAQNLSPAITDNRNANNYIDYDASTVKSYLYADDDGLLVRVEYDNAGNIIVEKYDEDFKLVSASLIPVDEGFELWGGFFAGEENLYVILGSENAEETDSKEVIRIIQYDKDWNRLKYTGVFGANTFTPFYFGSLRCCEYGGMLYILTCHTMYTSSDGLNHQANMMIAVNEKDLLVTDMQCDVTYSTHGYVSHSFNQYIIADSEGNLISLNHPAEGGGAVGLHILEGVSLLLHQSLCLGLGILGCLSPQDLLGGGVAVEVNVPGVAAADAVLRAHIQARRGGDHNQHHGAKDADGGKAGAVALHPVGHGGHGYKVVGFVVVPLILLQNPAKGHRACHKQQVGGDNHHDGRHEEPEDGGDGVRNGHRQVVGSCQNDHAQQRHQPVGLGRLFPGVLAAKKLHRVTQVQLPQGVEKQQKKNDTEQYHRLGNGGKADGKGELRLPSQDFHHGKLRKLGKENPQE